MNFSLKNMIIAGALLCSSDAIAMVETSNFEGFTSTKEINGVLVALRPLSNDKCTKINSNTGEKEVVFRDRAENEKLIKGIVLHYSVCPNADVIERVFYANGVSSHYDVNFEGEIFEFVNPVYIAFHAGKSAWNGDIFLNKNFIGIEQDMWGYYESNLEKSYDYGKFGQPVQLPGDDRKWFKFSDEQVRATGQLIFALQKKYNISGRNVVTHSDVAIGRKSDSGPMFPYKEIYEKYGAGYYPKSKYINLNRFSELTDNDYLKLLEIYGFNKGENGQAFDLTANQIIKAFKLHFYPGDLSEDLNDNTKKMILNLIASYYNYTDLITHSLDNEFRQDVNCFLNENKDRTQSLSELIMGWNGYSNMRAILSKISDYFYKFINLFRK